MFPTVNTVRAPFLLVFASFTVISILWYLKKKREFVFVGKVKKIIIYPIKSLPGVELKSGVFTKSGMTHNGFHDRSYCLIRNEKVLITQRNKPSLALLKTSFHDDELWIESPTQEPLKLKLNEELNENSKVVNIDVWGQNIEAVDCGDEAALWFQRYLDAPGFRLVRHAPKMVFRSSKMQSGNERVLSDKFPIRYQDCFPCHVINDNSVSDLNKKLGENEAVTYRNFRPNLLIECETYAEDKWDEMKAGEVLFKRLQPCDRCTLTTVNPDTGKMSKEPLATLRAIRKAVSKVGQAIYGNAPLFGLGLSVSEEGVVNVGDNIFATHFRNWKIQF